MELYDIEIISLAGTLKLPRMDERFVERLNFAKGRNEVFYETDAHGDTLTIGMEHVVFIRATKI